MKKNIIILIGIFIFFVSKLSANDIPIKEIIKKLHLTQKDLNLRGRNELKGFVDSGVWKGGYYEGDPLNRFGGSSYQIHMNYNGQNVNPLFACYSECIKPFINSNLDVLEIGPGWGAWTKTIIQLQPKSLTCIDALSAEHNEFWKHVDYQDNITYIQINDFLLKELKNNSIDFVFSFGTFCHISSIMCYEYFKNLFKKLRKGAQGFIMYADFDKKNQFALKYNLQGHLALKGDEIAFFKYQNETNDFAPTWYHLGIERASQMLTELGYEVINSDININERDPIIHFRKP